MTAADFHDRARVLMADALGITVEELDERRALADKLVALNRADRSESGRSYYDEPAIDDSEPALTRAQRQAEASAFATIMSDEEDL